jgi:hypothetical protein
MDEKFNKYNFKITDVCHCDCHRDGRIVIHCFPCCDLCDVKYLTEDGKLKIDKYIKIKEK